MIRRIKRLFGISARGSYFPNDDSVEPVDDSVFNSSRKSTKAERKAAKKALKKKKSAPAVMVDANQSESVAHAEAVNQTVPAELETNTIITDSLPYREPSDSESLAKHDALLNHAKPESQQFTNTLSTCATASVAPDANSNQSLIGSDSNGGCLGGEKVENSFVESTYSTDIRNSNEPIHERLVDAPEPEMTKEMEQKIDEMNRELADLLSKPAPFNVSTARLPPIMMLAGEPSQVIEEEFPEFEEKDNSVTKMLNLSHEAMLKSPQTEHLHSYGY